MHCVDFRAAPDLTRCSNRALGKHVAEALSRRDLFYQLDHGLMVAIDKLQTVRILPVDDAALVELIGKTYTAASADGVESEIVAPPVSPYACFDGCAVDRCGESPDGLILRTLTPGACILACCYRVRFAASRRAVVAAKIAGSEFPVLLAVYLLPVLLLAIAEISRGVYPQCV